MSKTYQEEYCRRHDMTQLGVVRAQNKPDNEGEIRVEFSVHNKIWVGREDAVLLIRHLLKVFKIERSELSEKIPKSKKT